jgi:hypothetical protein
VPLSAAHPPARPDGALVDHPATTAIAATIAVLTSALNVVLIYETLFG